MPRFAHLVIVALLMFSASGVSSLLLEEPCTGYELAGDDDRTCPPTCVTCGCCAQAVEPVTIFVPGSPDDPFLDVAGFPAGLPMNDPREILHVPKPYLV